MFQFMYGGYFTSAKYRTKPRKTTCYELELCASSGAKGFFNDTEYLRTKDSIFFCSPGTIRRSEGHFSCYYLHFQCDDATFCREYLDPLPTQMFTADYAEILRLMQNVIRHSKQDSTPKHNAANAALLQATMQIILITLFQQTAAVAEDATHRYAANILNACNYIDAHFRENIDIHKIAAAAMLSPSFTYVEFKKETGQTPHEYLIAKRMRAVCSALMFTNKSVFEIALECGFQNPNYLYHLFQKTYQTTPGKFRERFRKSL